MSVSVNAFRPVPHLTEAYSSDSGAIIVKVGLEGDGTVTLFFMDSENASPEAQVVAFVTKILKGCGFSYYDFDAEGALLEGSCVPVSTVSFDHPTLTA